tara:strand:- start:158 stop:367 length:210 start_codon:yes stop_codon:yes gene_type:complete
MSLSDKYIKIGEIAKILNVSRTTIYRWMEEGSFPKPVHFGDARKNSTIRWIQEEVEDWLKKRPRDKTDG